MNLVIDKSSVKIKTRYLHAIKTLTHALQFLAFD